MSDECAGRMIRHIFGEGATDSNRVGDVWYNRNSRGGEAYFLLSGYAGIDGVFTPEASTFRRTIDSVSPMSSVYIPDIPRVNGLGINNTPFYEYTALGLLRRCRKGGFG